MPHAIEVSSFIENCFYRCQYHFASSSQAVDRSIFRSCSGLIEARNHANHGVLPPWFLVKIVVRLLEIPRIHVALIALISNSSTFLAFSCPREVGTSRPGY